MNDVEHEVYLRMLARAHWLSTGLSIALLCPLLDGLLLREPVPIVLWLLGNVVVAAGRLYWQQLDPIELRVLKPLVWAVSLLSPVMLFAAYTANEEVIFRDAASTTRQYRSGITFGGGADEEDIITTHYQTKYGLYEEQKGPVEIKRAWEQR